MPSYVRRRGGRDDLYAQYDRWRESLPHNLAYDTLACVLSGTLSILDIALHKTQYRGVTMPLSWLAALSFLISTIASYSQVLLVMRHRAWYVKWRGPITAVRRLLVTLWVAESWRHTSLTPVDASIPSWRQLVQLMNLTGCYLMPLMAAFFRLRLVPSILLSVAGTCLLLHAVPTSCCSSMCNVAAAAGAAAAGGAATCADDGVAAAAAALCSQCIAAGAVPATLPAQLQALQRQQGRHAADAASIPSLVAHAMDVFALEWLGLPSVMLQRRATLRDGHDALAVCKAVGHTLQVWLGVCCVAYAAWTAHQASLHEFRRRMRAQVATAAAADGSNGEGGAGDDEEDGTLGELVAHVVLSPQALMLLLALPGVWALACLAHGAMPAVRWPLPAGSTGAREQR